MNNIKEANINLNIKLSKIPSKSMEVFYNPIMSVNRDITIAVLNAFDYFDLNKIAFPLMASGIRVLRYIKEVNKAREIYVNDVSKKAINKFKELAEINNIKLNNINIFNEDANIFLLQNRFFNYIDIDPFGSPVKFLHTALQSISKGILAITATDTATLCGVYPKKCLMRYHSVPYHGKIMHEIGLRILIKYIIEEAASFELGLKPLLSYYSDHYFRVFFLVKKSNKQAYNSIKENRLFKNKHHIYLGKLINTDFIKKLEIKEYFQNKTKKLINLFNQESELSDLITISIEELCLKYKIKRLPKIIRVIEALKQNNFKVSRTHINPYFIRTNASEKDLKDIILNITN